MNCFHRLSHSCGVGNFPHSAVQFLLPSDRDEDICMKADNTKCFVKVGPELA